MYINPSAGHSSNRPRDVVRPRQEEQIQASWSNQAEAGLQHGAQRAGSLPGTPSPLANSPPPRDRVSANWSSQLGGQLVSLCGGRGTAARGTTGYDTRDRLAVQMDRVRDDTPGSSAKLRTVLSIGQRFSGSAQERWDIQ